MIFSVYTNGRSLLSCKKSTSKDVMNCVHGIRVISTQWVVIGHTYLLYMAMPTTNTFYFMGDVSDSRNFFCIDRLYCSDKIKVFNELRSFSISVRHTLSQHVFDVGISCSRYILFPQRLVCIVYNAEAFAKNVICMSFYLAISALV